MELIDNENYIDEHQQALDLLALHGGYKKASKASGIPINVLNARQIVAIERGLTPQASILERNKNKAKEASTSKLVVNSDDVEPQDIIDDVLRVYSTRGNKVTEATYKQFGRYSKDVWGSIWHRFVSLQKAAGIKINRHQSRTNNKLARFAEDDIYTDMDNQRRRMEDVYNVEIEGKYATILCGSDFHDKFCDPFFRRVFIETARQMQPDIISLVGDMLDMYEFSSYHKSSEWINVQESFIWLTEFLTDLREACPNAQIDFLEGNHELRMWKSLCENDSIRQLFGDWMGLSIKDILKLDEFKVNYVGKTSLTLPSRGNAYMQSMSENNSRIYFSCFKADHYPTGRHGGISGVNGHHHKHMVWAGHNDLVGPTEWHQLGCGHVAKADYMLADKWSMGFATAVIRLDGYKYGPAPLINYHPVRDHANVEGMFFERQPHEYVQTDYPNKLLKL